MHGNVTGALAVLGMYNTRSTYQISVKLFPFFLPQAPTCKALLTCWPLRILLLLSLVSLGGSNSMTWGPIAGFVIAAPIYGSATPRLGTAILVLPSELLSPFSPPQAGPPALPSSKQER